MKQKKKPWFLIGYEGRGEGEGMARALVYLVTRGGALL